MSRFSWVQLRDMLRQLALKYWPMLLLFIAVVTVLCLSRYAEDRRAENQDNAQARNPQTSISSDDATKGTQKTYKPHHPPSWIETFTWPDGVTAWALLLTLLVIAWQSTETRDAAKSANAQIQMMKDKERARIAVDFPPSILDLDDGPEWTVGIGVVYAGTKIIVSNWGGTNAFNVTAKAQITETPGSPLLFDEVSVLDIPVVLKSNINPLTVDVISLLKGVDHVAAVQNKSEILYLVGTITYDDIFEGSHETRFRYRWEADALKVEGQSFDTSKWERTAEGNMST